MNRRRLIDWKVLNTLVPYSRTHVYRLMAVGKFPRSVKVGQHRTAWWEDEVMDWMDRLPRS